MPRGDGTGPMGAGPMTGRGMGPCAGSGKSGFFPRRGRGLGLLDLGMWLFRLWDAARQPGDVRPGVKNNEAEQLRKKMAEMEGTISELKEQLAKAKGDKG